MLDSVDRSASSDAAYDTYVRAEWALFAANESRRRTSLKAAEELPIGAALDIGCGAGQELLPFVTAHPALGIGLDQSPRVGHAGRQLFRGQPLLGRVEFVRAEAERLPFAAEQFDVVTCRLVLPYTRNLETLSEIARVLRTRGVVFLRVHHARFYLHKLTQSVPSRDFRSFLYAARVLLAGAVYHITGRQQRGRFLGGEAFQTEWLLRRELSRCGLSIREVLSDSTPRTPSYLLVKAAP